MSLSRPPHRAPSTPPRGFPPETPTASRRRIELELRRYDPLLRQEVGRLLRRLPPNVLRDDLYASGRVGLWRALLSMRERSTSYLAIKIRGAMLDELRAQDWLTRRARSVADGTRVVSIEDISNWTAHEPTAETSFERRDARALLEPWLGQLPPREQIVIRALYFEGLMATHVAKRLGVSAPRISQLRDRAIKRLREMMGVMG